MSDNVAKYVYWIATGLVALVYLGAATFYISSHDMVAGMYREVLGDGFVDYLLAIKEGEVSRYLTEVTDWEQREYFEIF